MLKGEQHSYEMQRDRNEPNATAEHYRNYFGVPAKTVGQSEFVLWAENISAAITTELPHTTLTFNERITLNQGLELALKVLSGHRAEKALS